MRALVSSDDGPDAPGFETLCRVVRGLGLTIHEASSEGETHSTGTALRDAQERLTCAAAVRSAIQQMKPDVVLVGINYGPNVGRGAVHSGTVGGVVTALAWGVSSIGFSLDDVYSTGSDEDQYLFWDTAAEVAASAIAWSIEHADDWYGLSLNIPNIPVPSIKGVARIITELRVNAPSDERSHLAQHLITVTSVQPILAVEAGPDPMADRSLATWIEEWLRRRQALNFASHASC